MNVKILNQNGHYFISKSFSFFDRMFYMQPTALHRTWRPNGVTLDLFNMNHFARRQGQSFKILPQVSVWP